MRDPDILQEVPEAGAPERVATLYDQIRRGMRVPMVALFYRNLAGIDGALEWMWDVIAPLLDDGRLAVTAARIARTGTLDPLSPLDAAPGAIDVIDAYNRANPLNFTCAAILAHLLAGERASGGPNRGGAESSVVPLCDAPEALPEMVETTAISPALQSGIGLLETSDTAGDGIIPSLYRHLAHWPDFLGEAIGALAPRFADGSLQTAARKIATAGREETAALIAGATIAPLPAALVTHRDAVSTSVEKFSRRIPEMIVVGRLLATATHKED